MLKKLSIQLRHQNRNVLVAIVLFMSSFSLIAYGATTQIAAPMPQPADASNASTPPQNPEIGEKQLSYSEPTDISIPSIGVESDLIQVGKNDDGTIEVPEGENYDKAAWYKYSSTPGQVGPTIIEGHIDSAENGPSVFFNLGNIKPGDAVLVSRGDGKTVTFIIDEINIYKKDDFPSEKVYGATAKSTIRLITCGGSLNRSAGEYDSNIIAFGHLQKTNK